jgi:hypothetical protein
MELPIDLGTANRYLDASEALRLIYESEEQARRAINHLGKSQRLAITTADGPKGISRGGCIIVHSPRCVREARRWVRERGFGERLDGFGRMGGSDYLATRELSNFAGPSFDIESKPCQKAKFV